MLLSLSLSSEVVEVVEAVVLVLLEATGGKVEADEVRILLFGFISSRLVPFVSGTKASVKTNPRAAIMA